MSMSYGERQQFAGIYKHHGGVKMRDSFFARGEEMTKDYVIDCSTTDSSNNDSDGSTSCPLNNNKMECVSSSDSESDVKLTQKDKPSKEDILLLQKGKAMPDSSVFLDRIILHDNNINSHHNKSVLKTKNINLPTENDESPTKRDELSPKIGSPKSEKFLESYEEVQPQSNDLESREEESISPVGFSKEISSSELDSLSSPSDNFLYAEIEKTLDGDRGNLISEAIEMDVLSEFGSKDKKPKKPPTGAPSRSAVSPDGTLEVSHILKDLDKGRCLDTSGMLLGYGHRPRNDEDDEGVAGSDSKMSTPSGYHSDVTDSTLAKHSQQNAEEAPASGLVPPEIHIVCQSPEETPSEENVDNSVVPNDNHCAAAIVSQPSSVAVMCMVTPGLEVLLDAGQVVVHMGNLRHDAGAPPFTDESFIFHLYSRERKEVMNVYCPSSQTCICHGMSWHCLPRCHFQAVIYAPPGCIVGFLRRSHSKFIQEFEILSPQEEILLLLRGAPNDLEVYSADLENELGRLSVHGWIGIMHEVRRTGQDYGLTFPLDLDVRIKAILIGSIFAIHRSKLSALLCLCPSSGICQSVYEQGTNNSHQTSSL